MRAVTGLLWFTTRDAQSLDGSGNFSPHVWKEISGIACANWIKPPPPLRCIDEIRKHFFQRELLWETLVHPVSISWYKSQWQGLQFLCGKLEKSSSVAFGTSLYKLKSAIYGLSIWYSPWYSGKYKSISELFGVLFCCAIFFLWVFGFVHCTVKLYEI